MQCLGVSGKVIFYNSVNAIVLDIALCIVFSCFIIIVIKKSVT